MYVGVGRWKLLSFALSPWWKITQIYILPEYWSWKFAKALRKKAIIHEVTTMLTTSENALFSGYNHLLTTSTDDPSLVGTRVTIKVSGHQYR